MVDIDLEEAQRGSMRHRAAVLASEWCGCFYCLAAFRPWEIRDWVDEPEPAPGSESGGAGVTNEGGETDLGETALCPRCGIDSVLPAADHPSLNFDFLVRMERRFFGMLSPERIESARRRFPAALGGAAAT